MQYVEIDTHNGSLGYNIDEKRAVLTSYRGRDVELIIPEKISAYFHGELIEIPVVLVAKKAFLSNKNLRRIELPNSVLNIGDWAFAGCRNLEELSLCRDVNLENGVFKDCVNLKRVNINGEENSDISFLLASVIYLLEDKYLFDLKRAGKDEWITNYDKRIDAVLAEPDDEGFVALLACGEEDYEGKDNTLEAYLRRRRMRKVRICFDRLLHDINLSEDRRKRLEEYLYIHRAGSYLGEISEQKSDFSDDGHLGRMHLPNSKTIYDENRLTLQDETWQVVLNEHGDEQEYYQMMIDCGCVSKENLDLMLNDMGDRHARMKAFLLKNNTNALTNSFFDDLEL